MFILRIYQIRRLDLRIYFIIKEKGGTCLNRGIPNQIRRYPPPGSGPNPSPAMAPLEAEQEFVPRFQTRSLEGEAQRLYRGGT